MTIRLAKNGTLRMMADTVAAMAKGPQTYRRLLDYTDSNPESIRCYVRVLREVGMVRIAAWEVPPRGGQPAPAFQLQTAPFALPDAEHVPKSKATIWRQSKAPAPAPEPRPTVASVWDLGRTQ